MKILQADNAFTLIEVLIAIAILSIGILGIYTMQLTAINGNSKANIITESTNSARNTIEQLISTDFNDSDFSTGSHNATGTPPVQSINWTVVDWENDGIDNDKDGRVDEFDERGVKNIQLDINYTEKGVVKTYTIQFLKTELF